MRLVKFILLMLTLMLSMLATSCSDAAVVSHNISVKADNFEVMRRIVFFNGITDTYMLTIEGLCNIEVDSMGNQLAVTCKTGDNAYKKHYLGLSDNVTYFVEQRETKAVSSYNYRIIFKPSAIISVVQIK